MWLHGPTFLRAEEVESCSPVTVRSITLTENELFTHEPQELDELVESSPNLYSLKKRIAYLSAFKEYCFTVKVKKRKFIKPVLDASYLDKAFINVVFCIQNVCFGSAVEFFKKILLTSLTCC